MSIILHLLLYIILSILETYGTRTENYSYAFMEDEVEEELPARYHVSSTTMFFQLVILMIFALFKITLFLNQQFYTEI